MIYRGAIEYRKDGFNTLRVHEYVGRGIWEIVYAGDAITCAMDLDRKARDAFSNANRFKKPRFYFCGVNSLGKQA